MYSDIPICCAEPLHVLQKTWKQMEQLVEEGLVKSIGISNFSVQKIQDLLKYAKIKPAVNQVELHPYFRNEKLHKYCDEQVCTVVSTKHNHVVTRQLYSSAVIMSHWHQYYFICTHFQLAALPSIRFDTDLACILAHQLCRRSILESKRTDLVIELQFCSAEHSPDSLLSIGNP